MFPEGAKKRFANCWENWRKAQEALGDFISKRLSFLNASLLFSECTCGELQHWGFAAAVPDKGAGGEWLGWFLRLSPLPSVSHHGEKRHSWRREREELRSRRAPEQAPSSSTLGRAGAARRLLTKAAWNCAETDSEQSRSERIKEAMPAWETQPE